MDTSLSKDIKWCIWKKTGAEVPQMSAIYFFRFTEPNNRIMARIFSVKYFFDSTPCCSVPEWRLCRDFKGYSFGVSVFASLIEHLLLQKEPPKMYFSCLSFILIICNKCFTTNNAKRSSMQHAIAFHLLHLESACLPVWLNTCCSKRSSMHTIALKDSFALWIIVVIHLFASMTITVSTHSWY